MKDLSPKQEIIKDINKLDPHKIYSLHIIHNKCGKELSIRYGKDISSSEYTEYYCRHCKVRVTLYRNLYGNFKKDKRATVYYTEG
jgi:hypothetical protein